ncbi:DUF1127 domain-containing protein [Rhizobium leguminosarum]|uniref:YjiS-like domain-containing protein n=1 Tax=Rhizobium johnstonii (strain DSM 114642 / LMG 32736 / 3841) TaxID=216596 RepID=Q1MES6_RHIJ3|nr:MULTISPECIES: DUF1127 domain-containing protein [Rhizobium]NKL22623.1 DUF1127 domain-containing protein [Rhizobium leguminosarum bv. viciae]CAK08549.1 conserved hypothetical protein [Rhizobium johnstonii 3841]MBY5372440.1 DUF1127 domain-containing protein [Rhizobium leguminosarum]NEI53867.1 DUF1127 domain-containing protein [Rhizobium leguminosarum]NEI82637.1 DUF1127 domain-containing protein [Rhizobium leguminosarum]
MAHTETHAGISAPKGQSFGFRPNSVAMIVAALRKWQRSVARRKALADLTPDQLRDIGYPRDDIGHPPANRPVLEIKAGLMTKLMSMR